MNLADQVVSLELSNKLKELGVKQESLFFWLKCINDKFEFGMIESNNIVIGNYTCWSQSGCSACSNEIEIKEKYSAFTVAELGEMLPETVISNMSLHFYDEYKLNKRWIIKYQSYKNENLNLMFIYEKNADARAKMLIYLIENKIITVESINAR